MPMASVHVMAGEGRPSTSYPTRTVGFRGQRLTLWPGQRHPNPLAPNPAQDPKLRF